MLIFDFAPAIPAGRFKWTAKVCELGSYSCIFCSIFFSPLRNLLIINEIFDSNYYILKKP
jgi:hypothetical protein